MGAADTVAALAGFEGRGAGTDAERRAAKWLAAELRTARREARIETFWSRPNWALAHAWHTALVLAGSLVSVTSPRVGAALILVAIGSVALDARSGRSLGRRFTAERASQNVVSPPPPRPNDTQPAARLIVTANYDAGRAGLVHRQVLRRPAARLRATAGPLALGWLGCLELAFLWLLVTTVLRDGGSAGSGIAIAQLIPTAGLVIVFALLLELSGSRFGPAANDNASGVAIALALARALDVSPPGQLRVELLFSGAGDGAGAGLAHHLQARRQELRRTTPGTTMVLGIAAGGGPHLRWWVTDGPLVPRRLSPRLAGIAAGAAGSGPEAARPHHGRGVSPALPARAARLSAITIGALDDVGLAPHSHLASDLPAALEPGAMDRVLELALTLVDAIDAELARGAATDRSASAPAAA